MLTPRYSTWRELRQYVEGLNQPGDYKSLREIVVEHGLSPSGNTTQLRARLLNYINKQGDLRGWDMPVWPTAVDEEIRKMRENLAYQPAPPPSPTIWDQVKSGLRYIFGSNTSPQTDEPISAPPPTPIQVTVNVPKQQPPKVIVNTPPPVKQETVVKTPPKVVKVPTIPPADQEDEVEVPISKYPTTRLPEIEEVKETTMEEKITPPPPPPPQPQMKMVEVREVRPGRQDVIRSIPYPIAYPGYRLVRKYPLLGNNYTDEWEEVSPPVAPPPITPVPPLPQRNYYNYREAQPASSGGFNWRGCLLAGLLVLLVLFLCGGLSFGVWWTPVRTGLIAVLGLNEPSREVAEYTATPTPLTLNPTPTAIVAIATPAAPTTVAPTTAPAAPTAPAAGPALPAGWPQTPDQASAMFGGPASRWETCSGPGCWHFKDGEPITRLTVPANASAEGWDGHAKIQLANGPMTVNAAGLTIRPLTPTADGGVQDKQLAPVAVISGQKAAWPTTAQEASALFGGAASRWETTADPGGWHLREEAFRTSINPQGYVLEGYYDTAPGKDARQFVSTQPIDVQGATVWSAATPSELFCAMIGQKYRGLNVPYNQLASGIDAIGFDKPASCPAK